MFLECTPLDFHISLHISPHGEDVATCGSLTRKCRTIDYAMNKVRENNITIILETSLIESQIYNVSKSISSRNCKIQYLRIEKDKTEGISPTIHGNNKPFIHQNENELYIEIESVNLINFFLLNALNHGIFNLSIFINDCTIYRTTPKPSSFIRIKTDYGFKV